MQFSAKFPVLHRQHTWLPEKEVSINADNFDQASIIVKKIYKREKAADLGEVKKLKMSAELEKAVIATYPKTVRLILTEERVVKCG